MSVLQVNKTNYETCNSGYPIHNWTTGAGRDVVPLNVTRDYYFISGNGFCYVGMKLAIQVEVPSPLPSPSPIEDQSPSFPPSLSPMNDRPSRFPPSVSPESGVSSKVTPSTAPVDNYSPRRRITNQNIVIPAMFAIALACYVCNCSGMHRIHILAVNLSTPRVDEENWEKQSCMLHMGTCQVPNFFS